MCLQQVGPCPGVYHAGCLMQEPPGGLNYIQGSRAALQRGCMAVQGEGTAGEGRDLQHSSEEGSGVGEAGQPVAGGVALVYPPPQLVQAQQQVPGPGAQGLQAGVGLQPRWGHLHTSHHTY